MISAVIPALPPLPALVDTLTALVPAVAQGLVRDVIIAAPEETRFLSAVTEAGGSGLVIAPGGRDALIRAALKQAKSDLILVLAPGMVPQGDWIETLNDALGDVDARHGYFLPIAGAPLSSWITRLTGRAHELQGLLATKSALQNEARLALRPLSAVVADRRSRGLKRAVD